MVEFMRTLLHVNIFIFDYSGYGLSRGIPSEKQFYRDGQDAINFVESRDDLGEGIFLFGRSLGGAVVIDLAVRPQNENLSGIIVENTFTSVPAMGTVLFSPAAPIINLLPQFAIKNKFYRFVRILINSNIIGKHILVTKKFKNYQSRYYLSLVKMMNLFRPE